MWSNSTSDLKLLFVTLSLTILSTMFVLNFQSAFSQNEELSYLDVNSTNSAQLSKFTVAAWFKTPTDYNSDAFIMNKAGASDNMNYGIWMTNTEKVRGGFETPNGNAFFATSPLSYSDGKWHYVVVTFDGSTITLYLDGLPVATKSTSGSPDSGGEEPIRMGANSQSLNNFFIGNVDEIRVWKSSLSAQQVIDAYNGDFNTKDLVEYLGFSEPIVPLNNTAAINGTVTNQTGFQDINGTVTNETSALATLVNNNDTSNANDTADNIQPVEIPQIINNIDTVNDTGTGNQKAAAQEENNFPEAFDQSVSVEQDGQVEITLVASDEDNDLLQFDVTADPLQGGLVDFGREKGTVTYVPKEGYFGNDKFSFRVTDDKGSESNVAEVNVNVKEAIQPTQNAGNEESKIVENIINTTRLKENGDINPVQQPNQAPKADAGDNQKAEVNSEVKLDGSDSGDEDGEIVSYKWKQTDGPEVDVKKSDKQTASFDVPSSAADSKLVFKLTVTDDKDDSASDDVTVDVGKIADDESNSEDESN
jgi:Concanavalin A-like lectin/glucanases superfamily/Bacterial Ig domain